MSIQERQTSLLFEGNARHVEEQYELYLADPASVTDEWRAPFDAARQSAFVSSAFAE
ncbi:hypothetical protein [Burkholderia sp. Ac-20353]|uniref:2-oxoglutarate dehydrogenase E1 subunit family protein n=1 Tax=Burkholderia sp. Ac-20353 TaxID=2703894 RepID=UPI00197B7CBF|nr:hypothetical protein [Burkholderia sp. Ac-20353]MBN3785409.1 hypothetical protein [Burkholderia sp. Ac-20353]